MHLKRWITGLCALPFLIFLVYLGGAAFILLVGIACVCSLWEYDRIVFNADRRMMYNAVTFLAYVISLGILAIIVGTLGAASRIMTGLLPQGDDGRATLVGDGMLLEGVGIHFIANDFHRPVDFV